MANYMKEKVDLYEQVWQELQHLPRGLELANDLQMAVFRLLAAGADRDAIKIIAITASDSSIVHSLKAQKNR